jgi:tetratricopeptide (TPR) repeat protein
MTRSIHLCFWVLAIFALTLPAALRAANEGQADLDKATEARLNANTIDDLQRVIDLAEGALKKGLDEGNVKFAKQLLSSTYYQRAEKFSDAIFERAMPSPQWPQIRAAAIVDLEKALTIDENFGNAHYLLGKLLAISNADQDKATKHAEKAVELLKDKDKNDLAKAYVLRGSLLQDYDKRLADFGKALDLDADNVDALRARGLLLMSKDKHKEALADFKKLIEFKPKDLLGQVAMTEILTDLKEYDEALKHADKVIELQPRAAEGHLLRAKVRIMEDKLKLALADIDNALKAEPEDLGALLLRARLRHTTGDKKEARADLDRALQVRPGLPQAILLRSLFSASEKKYDEAINDVQRLLAGDPGNADYLQQLAAYYSADKRPRKAIDVLDTILSVDEDNLEARRARGDALLTIGLHKEAIADFEKVLKAKPDNSGVLNNLAWTLSTTPDDKLRNGKRAVELATRAAEETKYKAPHILSTLASAYAESGDFDKAREWSEKALAMAKEQEAEKKDPNDRDAELLEQLGKELQSYKDKKPWREKQQTEEKGGKKPPPVDLDL